MAFIKIDYVVINHLGGISVILAWIWDTKVSPPGHAGKEWPEGVEQHGVEH